MHDVLIPLLIDILTELTEIRLLLTYNSDPVENAQDAANIICNKSYLSHIIEGYEIKEV